MKRIELARKLVGVNDLMQLVQALRSGNTAEWVGLGLLTAEEYAEYSRLSTVESQMYSAIRKAGESVAWITPHDQYPKEYLRIIDRMDELKPDVDLANDMYETLRSLAPFKGNRYSGDRTLGGDLGVEDVSEKLFSMMQGATTGEIEEYRDLEAAKERRNRDGSIARRVNQEAYRIHEHEKHVAEVKAEAAFRVAHLDDLNRYYALEALVDTRREAKIKEIGKAIRVTLEKVLEEVS